MQLLRSDLHRVEALASTYNSLTLHCQCCIHIELIQAVRRSRKPLTYALAVLHNLTLGSSADAVQRRTQLAQHRAFCCQILQV
jgi:hypothetical protein